ncbi:MAG: DUF2219 family protein, partial [Gammaproteobacteria bacterium]|nr:DUF2219 family protein [Gammaproteobacteria bacterium]
GNYKLRVYNAILQGQFRDSAVTFSDDDLERFTAEFSTGVVWEFSDGYRLSLFYRHRTPAMKSPSAREPRWGGLTISKSF